jgi:anti-sigma B factor antagonist
MTSSWVRASGRGRIVVGPGYNPYMKSEPLQVERPFNSRGGGGVLVLKGPLVTENLADFQNAIRRENVPTVILDLTEVPYIDSAGLGSLVTAYVTRHKSGQRTVLTGVNSRIVHLLEITKMAQLFPIFPSLADALDALSRPGRA